MPPKKKKREKTMKKTSEVGTAHLPGYLMIAFGLLGLGLNFDLFEGFEWAKAYPLLVVLFGITALVKMAISRN